MQKESDIAMPRPSTADNASRNTLEANISIPGKISNLQKRPDMYDQAWDGFVNAYLHYDPSKGPFEHFAYRASKNNLIDAVRKSVTQTKAKHAVTSELVSRQQEDNGFETQVVNRLALNEITQSLTPIQKQIIKYVVVGGLTYAAVSKILKIPEGTARRRMQQALSSLRRHPHIESLKD